MSNFSLLSIIILFCLFTNTIGECQDSLNSVVIDTAAYVEPLELSIDEVPENSFFQDFVNHKIFPFFLLILFLMSIAYRIFSNLENGLKNQLEVTDDINSPFAYDTKESLSTYSATKNSLKFFIPITIFIYSLYIAVVNTPSEGYFIDWFNLMIRWAHVVAGIMWIGASFYFVFLENNLNRTKNIRDELAGNLWAVHGGGFYFLEKYKVAPNVIPKDLHWFKYEAYFTFITGFLLLVVVYYINADAYLIDSSIEHLSKNWAICIGVLSICISWIIYDLLCKSVLIENQLLFGLIGLALFTLLAFGLTEIFNPRAAFIHVGAAIGAIMVGNVYFNIIPAQKAMVRSATIGENLDASLGIKAGQRSLHNNYFTLPVIFIMISNHYPMTFGHEWNWLILMIISIASVGIKHFWNLAERGIVRNKILACSVIILLSLAYIISPIFESKMDLAIPVSFDEANQVIKKRCISCHSAYPTDDVWKVAPNGVMYDTPTQIKAMSVGIMTRAVRTKSMPQGNKTKMTDEERVILKRWILQGSKIPE